MSSIENIVNAADRTLQTVEKNSIADINRALGAAFKLLEDKFYAAYDKGLNSESEYMTKLKVLISELDAVLTLVNPNNTYYRDRLLKVVENAADLGIKSGENIFKEIDPEDKPINARLNVEALAFTADRAAERMQNYSAAFRSTAIQVIGSNLAIGSSTKKTARQLRNTLEITKGKAEMLVRTESISALNRAADNFYAQNEVDYVQVFATADERVCPYCASRNQSIYRRGSISLPLHPYCRCFATPVKPQWLNKELIDKDFSDRYFAETLDKLKAVNKDLNRGAAPFEKLNGLSAPRPVWQPGSNFPRLSVSRR